MSVWEEGEPAWVFPQLQQPTASGTVVGGYLEALLPAERGGKSNGKYLGVLVDSLPDNANAGGIRPGIIINELAASMPAELVVQASGHNFASMSALWEYLDASLALCMAAAIVLGGWPALSWGLNGMGGASLRHSGSTRG
jgi:hypothetical protein